MKKILLAVFLIILLPSVCFAKSNVDLDRWEWVIGNGTINYYHDKQSIQYSNNGNDCNVDILRIDHKEKHRSIVHYLLRKDRTINVLFFSNCDYETRDLFEVFYETFFPKRKYDPLLYIDDEG